MTDQLQPLSRSAGAPSGADQVEFEEKRRLLGRAMLRVLTGGTSPLSHLPELWTRVSDIADQILESRGAPTKSARMKEAGKATLTGVFVYWVGLATGLAFPPVGILLGAIGSAGLTMGYKKICETRRDYEFLRTFLSCLLLMEQADNKITDLERKQIEAFIASLPISEADRNELRGLEIKSIDEVSFPSWFEFSHARAILSGCYTLSYCDGIAAEELAVFRAIGEKLGVNPKELKSIKEEATETVETFERKILRIALTAPLLWPEAVNHRSVIIEILGSLSIRRRSADDLRLALEEIEGNPVQQRVLEGNRDYEESVLGSSLVLCFTLADERGGKSASEAFLERCRPLKRDNEGKEFLGMVEQAFQRVR